MRYLIILTIFAFAACQVNDSKLSVWGNQGFDLPIVDLDNRHDLQVLVDKEKGQYLGHPSTLLLEDGKTIICVYPKGHGRGAIILKKSTDGGKTWSKRLPTPDNWSTSREVPTLYSTVDPKGKKLILMFSGMHSKNRMAISEDAGETFSELKDIANQKGAIVVMSDLIDLKTGKGHYMATYHHNSRIDGKKTLELYTTFTLDGGRTWSNKVIIHKSAGMHLCEGGFVRSPDGSEIALLLRENSRRVNSQIMFSRDEGKTWSAPRSMPGSLCGDRHQIQKISGNRLLIQFRDNTPKHRKGHKLSPTEGDWCGWVGTWEDLRQGYEGQYRIRFKDNKHGWDTTYPAAELLSDGTLVCTTYGHFDKGEKPYILSFRFKMDELDRLAEEIRKKGQTKLFNDMGNKVHLYDPNKPEVIRGRNSIDGSIEVFQGAPRFDMQQLFTGERFPNVIVAMDGTLLTTWGRKSLQVRRSEDGGKSWGSPITVGPGLQGGGTTVDEISGDILVFVEEKHPPAPLTVYRSKDSGKTWSAQKTVIHPDSRGNVPSMSMNEHGITLRHSRHSGRLLRPARWYGTRNKPAIHYPTHYTTAIYSDDGGKTWQTSNPFPEFGTGEAAVAELSDGTIYYNTRRHWAPEGKNPHRRWHGWSRDGGKSWQDVSICEVLPDGAQDRNYGLMGGLIRLPVEGKDILIYSNIV